MAVESLPQCPKSQRRGENHDKFQKNYVNLTPETKHCASIILPSWWLWPNTCLMRFPERSNFIVLHIIPAGPDRTLETLDFFFETPEPDEAELDAIEFFDDVLQVEDIGLVKSVQRGMSTRAFNQGRIVVDPNVLGKSEHALHHFHGLVLDAYTQVAGGV